MIVGVTNQTLTATETLPTLWTLVWILTGEAALVPIKPQLAVEKSMTDPTVYCTLILAESHMTAKL